MLIHVVQYDFLFYVLIHADSCCQYDSNQRARCFALVLSRNLFVARVRRCQGDIQIIDLYSPVAAEKTPV